MGAAEHSRPATAILPSSQGDGQPSSSSSPKAYHLLQIPTRATSRGRLTGNQFLQLTDNWEDNATGGASGTQSTALSPFADYQHHETALPTRWIRVHPRQTQPICTQGKRAGTSEDMSSLRGSPPPRPSLAPAPRWGQQHQGIWPNSTSHQFPAWDPDECCPF